MLIFRLLPFIYAVTARRCASDVTCFERGHPIEAKCSSIGLRTTILESYCMINDPQRTVRSEYLPALKATDMPPLRDTAALARRGFSQSASVYMGGYTCRARHVLVGKMCYHTILEELNFAKAMQRGKDMSGGVTLPSFHSDADIAAMFYFLEFEMGLDLNTLGPIWTGSYYEDTWKNWDGSEADFFRWAPMSSNTGKPSAQVILPSRFNAITGSYLGYFSARPQSEKHVCVFIVPAYHVNQPPGIDHACTYESEICVNDQKLNCLTMPLFYAFSAQHRLYAFDTDMRFIGNFAKHYGIKLPWELTNTDDPAGVSILPHILPHPIIPWVNSGLQWRTPINRSIIYECPSITKLIAHRSSLSFFYTTSEATLNEVGKNPDYDMATKRIICYVWPGLVEL